MRKRLLRLVGWLQLTLFLASPAPMLYAVLTEGTERLIWPVFWCGFLILVPIAVLSYAVQKCKYLWLYLAAGLGTMALMGGAAYIAGLVLTGGQAMWGYVIVMLVETFALMQWYLSGRLQWQNEYTSYLQERENVTFQQFFRERQMERGMSKPYLIFLFPVAYLAGLGCDNAPLCDLAVFLTAVYAALLVLSMYLEKTEEYLSLHKSTKSVPRRRIYGIGRGMLVIFLILLAAGMLPGISLAGRRSYTDVRTWMDDYEPSGLDDEIENRRAGLFLGHKRGKSDMDDWYHEPPAWLNGLFYLAAAAAVFLVIFFVFRAIRRTFVDFRAALDENGDLVEELEEEPEDMYEPVRGRKRRVKKEQDVRFRYRSMIKKHRKELPMPWETPTEIETNAGLAEDEAMRELHGEYEKVRYGK